MATFFDVNYIYVKMHDRDAKVGGKPSRTVQGPAISTDGSKLDESTNQEGN